MQTTRKKDAKARKKRSVLTNIDTRRDCHINTPENKHVNRNQGTKPVPPVLAHLVHLDLDLRPHWPSWTVRNARVAHKGRLCSAFFLRLGFTVPTTHHVHVHWAQWPQ